MPHAARLLLICFSVRLRFCHCRHIRAHNTVLLLLIFHIFFLCRFQDAFADALYAAATRYAPPYFCRYCTLRCFFMSLRHYMPPLDAASALRAA